MIRSFEGLRGFAAVLVIFFHGWDGFVHRIGLVMHAWQMVDLFFVLSGAVMAHVYAGKLTDARDAAVFIVRRLGRLYPLHVATAAAFVAQAILVQLVRQARVGDLDLAQAVRTTGIDPQTLLAHLTLTHSLGILDGLTLNAPSWSISTEFWAYTAFAGVVLVLGRRHLAAAAALIALTAVTVLIGALGLPHMNTTFDYGFLRCLYGFFLGVAAGLLAARAQTKAWSPRLLSGLQLAAVAASVAGVSNINLMPKLTFFMPCVFAVLVFGIAADRGVVARCLSVPVMQYLGKISYSIYMCHALVLPYFKAVALSMPLFVADIVYLPYLVCVLVLGHLGYRFIEVPGRELGYRLSMRLTTRRVASA